MTTDLDTAPRDPVDQIDAGSRPYNFLALDADDFERLSNALFAVSAPPTKTRTWDRATLMIKGADAGRDVALFSGHSLVGAVQCKRLESGISLPTVMQEVAKLILQSRSRDDVPDIGLGVTYFLVLARDPASTVTAFFDEPAKTVAQRPTLTSDAVNEVLSAYETLKTAWPDTSEALRVVLEVMTQIDFVLVRPHDLTAWLSSQPSIASQFFRQRLVVDNTALEPLLKALDLITMQTAGVSLLVDEDLKMIKDRIDGTPESHRLNLGLAATFGLPRDMMVGPGFEKCLQAMSGLYGTLFEDFYDWLLARAKDRAEALTAYGPGLGVPPFARQVAAPFLALVLADQTSASWSGQVMTTIVAAAGGRKPAASDEDRLTEIRTQLLTSGRAWLAGDFSELVGSQEDIDFKREIIAHVLDGIHDPKELEETYDRGVSALKAPLMEIADELRALCKHRPSIFLGSIDFLDDPSALKRLAGLLTASKSRASENESADSAA